MFKKYFNKMVGKDTYSIKLDILPIAFVNESDRLREHYNEAAMNTLIGKVSNLHELQKRNKTIQERAKNTGMFLKYLEGRKNNS